MTETQETFGSKLLNTVMEAMFCEEMTELEAWVARMERLYPPELEARGASAPSGAGGAVVVGLPPETVQRVRNGYMVPSQHAELLVSTIAGQSYSDGRSAQATLAAQAQALYAYNRQAPIGLPSTPQRDLYDRITHSYQQMTPRDRYEWLRQSNTGLDMRGLTGMGAGLFGGIFGGLF